MINFSRQRKRNLSLSFKARPSVYNNEFNVHVTEISFSYERMGTKTRLEKHAKS